MCLYPDVETSAVPSDALDSLELSSWDETLQGFHSSLRCPALLFADDRNWVVRYFPPLGSILILERLQTRLVDFLRTYKCASYVLLQEVNLVLLDPLHQRSQLSGYVGTSLRMIIPSVL